KVGRKNTFLHTVEAQLEAVSRGKRRERIRTNDFLAAEDSIERNELAGFELNLLRFGNLEQKVPDVGSELPSFEQGRLHAPSLAAVNASFARSSKASKSAGCPSRGDVTCISTPPSASEALRTKLGRSRCICVPSVRKYGIT